MVGSAQIHTWPHVHWSQCSAAAPKLGGSSRCGVREAAAQQQQQQQLWQWQREQQLWQWCREQLWEGAASRGCHLRLHAQVVVLHSYSHTPPIHRELHSQYAFSDVKRRHTVNPTAHNAALLHHMCPCRCPRGRPRVCACRTGCSWRGRHPPQLCTNGPGL
jgi:hypothetical protein